MTHELILQNIAKHIALDETETSYFTSLLVARTIPKKAFVLKEKQVCHHIFFVHSGTLRAYYVNKAGKEATIMFAVKDWWITDMYCFINRLPAMLNIETLEESCLFQLQKSDLDKLYVQVPKFEKFFRVIMQNAYIREQLRVIDNIS